MKDENKIIAALAFAGGLVVGANWNRIKNFTKSTSTKIKEKLLPIHKEITIHPSKKISSPAKRKPDYIFCPQCKAKLKSTAKFCYKCGREL